jgi:hypothetical protein
LNQIDTLKSGLISAINTTEAALDQNGADTLLEQIYCAVGGNTCFGICPNADISGIGVRIAFYLNAIMTGCLVALDPQESPGAGKNFHISSWSDFMSYGNFSMVVDDSYGIHRHPRNNSKKVSNANLIPCHPSVGFCHLLLRGVFGSRMSKRNRNLPSKNIIN